MRKALPPLTKSLALFALTVCFSPARADDSVARVQLTDEDVQNMYAQISMQRTSVHDPSIVYDETKDTYYIFGSHIATAKSSDLENWTWVSATWGTVGDDGNVVAGVASSEAFHTNQTKEITINGETVAFGNFDAAAWNCALPTTDANGTEVAWSVNGNMWAPDVIYNPTMGKWCQYLSLNGSRWNSCIILLTADQIEGPYVYQGPVVYTGFRNDTDERISFHKTDLELVIGPQTSLPDRYARGESWGTYWPHAIDPCVFYDEEGKLWMSYGSWSGGIYILELDENTGLRDYNVTYPSDYASRGARVSSDPYFGTKIAGGYYVSGEGSYIEHVGDYYYLFMSYGGLEPNGGYEMRVFRSATPNGPYTDPQGTSAIFTNYRLNFGLNSDTRGEKILGAYNDWGLMTVGECAQGHNSVIAAHDGHTYLVYHTKFNDGTQGHQVRVHQLFLNEAGWLVAAPFEYHGQAVGDSQIASSQAFSPEEVAGNYQLLLHRYALDHANYEEMTPVDITLNADGTVTGAYNGRWEIFDNNSYINLTLGSETYQGVVVEQQMEPTTIKAVCFTACNAKGTNVWGYKMKPEFAVAYEANSAAMPVNDGQVVTRNLDFYGTDIGNGVEMKWTSSKPDIISNTGKYNPAGLTSDTPVEITVELSAGNYSYTRTFQVTARAETFPSSNWANGIVAYYSFDAEPFVNAYDKTQEARFLAQGNNTKPALEQDSIRNGNIVHQFFGANGNCSYAQMPNPLYGADLEGMTVSLWVKRTDEVLWDAIWSFYNAAANSRIYLTGNSYIGFNNGTDWFDINHPNAVVSDNIPVGEWCLVTITASRTNGCTIYINGSRIRSVEYVGSCNETSITDAGDFDYNKLIDFIQTCPNFYLGYGSFWGSVDIRMDDIIIYNRELSATEVRGLNTMSNRVTNFGPSSEGGVAVPAITAEPSSTLSDGFIYNLSGQRVAKPQKGNIYIVNGKKVIWP